MTLFYADELTEALDSGADAVDLFAGPGGWDVGLHQLGRSAIGVELDRWACATRRAAGWPTVEASVADVDPHEYSTVRGVIASPPCQAFSTAGKKTGVGHVDQLVESITAGRWSDRCAPDPRVWLALDVGRWVEAIRPEWVALEQVPAVLPLWQAYAEWLSARGYSTWVGKLNAADYGVPQIRWRSILVASLVREVGPPPPTHSATGEDGLERHITMASALGWTGRVGFPRRYDGGAGGETEDGYRAFTVTEKARSWLVDTGRDWSIDPETGATSSQTFDPAEQPALAITGKTGGQWHLLDADEWPHHRPATTAPGSHRANDGRDNTKAVGRSDNAVMLTIPEALTLQGFPPDYPVRGGRTKAFEQVGNAIPPPLARHILSTVLDP